VTISSRDRRALIILAAALAVYFVVDSVFLSDTTATTNPAAVRSSSVLRQRVALLRQTAATLPAREALLKQADADLADREQGIMQADTAAEAQADLVQTARRLGKANAFDVRGSDSAAPRVFGDYGLVYATVSFDCHIEQLLNFLADLTREPALIVPSEERMASGNPKDKMMTVRMTLAGIVAKKLVAEKKGPGAF
jgi:hypothetical protein